MSPRHEAVGSTRDCRVDGDAQTWADLQMSIRVVECELNTRCNRACSYCPQAAGLVATDRFMDDAILGHLLSDLARIDFSGRFSHHFYGEPLLHPTLPTVVRRIRASLPRAVQVLFTNGDFLDDDKHQELLAAGIELFIVTRHQAGSYPERPHQVVQRVRELDFTSRGGAITWLKKKRSVNELRTLPCYAPKEMLIVSWDGKLVRCYEDARRERAFGDLRTHTLGAIWELSRGVRQALACGSRSAAGSPCTSCDNTSHVVPGRSVATEPFWQLHPSAVAVAARILGSVRSRETPTSRDDGSGHQPRVE